jgi:hypothetical protein
MRLLASGNGGREREKERVVVKNKKEKRAAHTLSLAYYIYSSDFSTMTPFTL